MCGVIGVWSNKSVVAQIYNGLTMLQHRGQDAAGIVTWDEGSGQFNLRKRNGLVRDVFRSEHLESLNGKMGIGHVRYPTAGCDSDAEAQPFYVNSPYGIVLAHNGNLINAKALATDLYESEKRHINTSSDSEVLLNIFASELRKAPELTVTELMDALDRTQERIEGGYAVVGMVASYGLFAFRDGYGLRPLVLGKKARSSRQTQWMVASESVALDALGFTLERDVRPGEAIFIDSNGQLHSRHNQQKGYSPCSFEYVYLARPDSIQDKVSVYQARVKMGAVLAQKILRDHKELEIDTVMPVPDTARTAALAVAQALGATYSEGIVKNRYIGRTFIMPGQQERKRSVRQKLNMIRAELEGKHVLIIDDSIVRGTTSRKIVQLARSAGAKSVYFASTSPPIRHRYIYGIDMPSQDELIAYNRSIEEVKRYMGADGLFYPETEEFLEGLKSLNPEIDSFDVSCFNGEYTTGGITEAVLEHLEQQRSEARDMTPELCGIHNVK